MRLRSRIADLEEIAGRERNLPMKPEGTRYRPPVGFAQFHDIAPIVQYRFVQHDPDRIEVRLVPESTLTPGQESNLAAVIQKALGAAFNLEFAYFEREIPKTPGGKFEEFMCKIAPGP